MRMDQVAEEIRKAKHMDSIHIECRYIANRQISGNEFSVHVTGFVGTGLLFQNKYPSLSAAREALVNNNDSIVDRVGEVESLAAEDATVEQIEEVLT